MKKILFYPSVFNPLTLITCILLFLLWIVLSWIGLSYEYVDFSSSDPYPTKKFKIWVDHDGWELHKRYFFTFLFTLLVNSYWWNRKRTEVYVPYLMSKYFSKYPKTDWRYEHTVEEMWYVYKYSKVRNFQN